MKFNWGFNSRIRPPSEIKSQGEKKMLYMFLNFAPLYQKGIVQQYIFTGVKRKLYNQNHDSLNVQIKRQNIVVSISTIYLNQVFSLGFRLLFLIDVFVSVLTKEIDVCIRNVYISDKEMKVPYINSNVYCCWFSGVENSHLEL